MSTRRPHAPRPPTCPRCGYDQSGVLATWREQCPVASTCSECGLEFAWRDVLSPTHGRVAWLYEHGRGPAIGRLLRSMLMAIVPSRFWRRVRMSHDISLRRLAIMVVLLVAILHPLVGANRLGAEAWAHHQAMTVWARSRAGAAAPIAPSWTQTWAAVSEGGDWFVVGWKAAIAPGSLWSTHSPAESLSETLSRPSFWLIVLHLWWAFMLLALPDTRALARVRPAHLARSLAYPSAVVLGLLYLGAAAGHWVEAQMMLSGRFGLRSGAGLELASVVVGLGWAAWWWLGACRTYLRLPRPILVWLVTGGIAVFGTIVSIVATAVFVLSRLRYG